MNNNYKKVIWAMENLANAGDLFDSCGMTKQAEVVTYILTKVAKLTDEEIQELKDVLELGPNDVLEEIGSVTPPTREGIEPILARLYNKMRSGAQGPVGNDLQWEELAAILGYFNTTGY